jgi:alpha-mannosidase
MQTKCNKNDWQSKEVSLKAAFPTTVSNEVATYGLNIAAIKRSTNNEVKYEVPARQWFDLTNRQIILVFLFLKITNTVLTNPTTIRCA